MYYEIEFTEHNGEQEYTYNYLMEADTKSAAEKTAKDFVARWYGCDDADSDVADWVDENTVEFFGGCIRVVLESVIPTTKRDFACKMVSRYSIGIGCGSDNECKNCGI